MVLSLASCRRYVLLAVVAFVVSACNADFDVFVSVNPDGSGLVSTRTSLDDETTERLLDLDLDATGVVLDDLALSGWVIVPPVQEANGSTVIIASKEFGTTEQFSEVMEELSGAGGVFRDFELVRSKTFARVGYELTGTIDTTLDFDSFADEELTLLLERPLAEIASGYGAVEDQMDFNLQIELPGGVQGEAPVGIIEAEPDRVRAEWDASLADNEVESVALRSATREVTPLVLRGVAGLAAVVAGLVIFSQIVRVLLPDRRRRPRRRAKPKPKPEATPEEPRPTPADSTVDEDVVVAAAEEEDDVGPYKVLAIDAMGVLYREADDVTALLIPFIRERSSIVPSDEEIEAKARSLSLGRTTTGQFWTSVGVEGDPAELDAAYLAQIQLMPGVIKYLRAKRERGIKVACVTNNSASWAKALRDNHDLVGLVDPWIVSGSIGVRKPDRAIYEVLRRVAKQPADKILVVDDDLAMLDAARAEGFATAWFAPNGDPERAGEHQHIRSFDLIPEELPDNAGVSASEPSTVDE